MPPPVVVHTTPPLGPLPASDADSLRLIATLRLAGVGAAVQTAEWSANGQPFVTLNNIAIAPRHLPSLPGWRDPDAALSGPQRADAVAWKAYVDGQVVDLVNHSLYSLPPNYPVIAEAQLAALQFPMTFYVPQRLRSIVKSRLESVGLWGLGGVNDGDSQDEDRKRLEDSFVVAPGGTKAPRTWSGWRSGREVAERKRKFGEETLQQRARAVFEPLARKLGESNARFFYGNRPCSLDVALFAQLSLVLCVALPNPLLADLLRNEFPSLVTHRDSVVSALLPGGWTSIERLASPRPRGILEAVRDVLPTWAGGSSGEEHEVDEEHQKDQDAERKFALARWAWFAGAGVALATYVVVSGIISVEFEEGDDDDDEDDEDEEFDEDDLEFSGLAGLGGYDGHMPVWDDDEEE